MPIALNAPLRLLSTSNIIRKYGNPGDESLFVKIVLPYRMTIAWDKKFSIGEMTCHKLVAGNFTIVFEMLLREYGLKKIQALGIDLYGGCYNFRKMRGGKDWSRHSWAIALDLDPDRNKLHETKDTARFARPEYARMEDIFYENNFISLGREQNRDFMHFEIGI